MTDGTNNGIDGYSQTRVGDHTILTPKDKKASVYQKVTPREQYAVARDVANRAINEINAIRGDRASSFTGGINDANIAARMQAAETYGDTLAGRQPEASFRPIVGIGSDVPVRGVPVRELIDADRVRATAPQISEIKGDWGYGPSIRYPEPDTSTPSENYDSWINQQYNELLGRDAGTEGLNYWTGDLTRGQTKDQVRSNIMLGDEFKNRLKLVTDYRNEFGTDPDESWLDERVGPGGVWLMEGYGDDVDVDVDVSDPETFLQAFGQVGRNSGPTGGRGLGNKGGNKSSSGPSSNSNRGTGGQGRQGRTSTSNNPSSNKGKRGGKGGASTGRRGGQGNKGRGM